MSLPMTKSALDRLGARLAASDPVANADLEELARAVGAYQKVLDEVKGQLTELGYGRPPESRPPGRWLTSFDGRPHG